MSAVSNRVTPASRAAWTTTRVLSASSREPKLLQPSPTTETGRPDLPSLTLLWDLVAAFVSVGLLKAPKVSHQRSHIERFQRIHIERYQRSGMKSAGQVSCLTSSPERLV